jgi:hypothetical protein
MGAPIVAGAADLRESGGIDQADTPLAQHQIRRAGDRSRQQFAQQPEQPSVGVAQVVAPGSVGNIGDPLQNSPDAQQAERVGLQDVGQQAAQEIGRAGKATRAHKCPVLTGLVVEVGRQARDELAGPGIAGRLRWLQGDGGRGMMGVNGHDFLL